MTDQQSFSSPVSETETDVGNHYKTTNKTDSNSIFSTHLKSNIKLGQPNEEREKIGTR